MGKAKDRLLADHFHETRISESHLIARRRLIDMRISAPESWDGVSVILGTTEDMTQTGTCKPCIRCGVTVYTSRHYPDHLARVCPDCVFLVEAEDAVGKEAHG